MKKRFTKMSSEAINIVLNLSLDGTILSFSVEKVVSDEELMEVKSESNSPDVCPACTCRISVFTRQFSPVIKLETLLEKEDIDEDVHDVLDTKGTDNASSDEDEKPIIELFLGKQNASNSKPSAKSKRKSKKEEDSSSVMTALRCLHCNIIISNENSLIKHQKTFDIVGGPSEPVPDAVKCTEHCKRLFANEEELQMHLEKAKMVKKKRIHKCEQCPEVFRDVRTYQNHLFKHGPCKCPNCEMVIKDRKSYAKHKLNHIRFRTHLCKICNQRFDTEAIVAVHIRWFHTMERACSFCGKTLANYKALLEHENKHKNIAPYQCDQCGASFSREDGLYHHSKKHQGIEYICDLCGKSYKNKPYLKHHMLGHQKEPEKVFQCDQCPKSFTNRLIYRIHVKYHAEKTFPCPECGKLFTTKTDVKYHINCVHAELSNRPKFTCETCGKVLLSKNALRIHMNLHKEVTEFKCRYCPHNAISFHTLKRHEMFHTGERPFTCQTCGKCFRHSDTLKTHIRLHTGEKPYECPLEECKKRFSDRGCFRSHLVVHEKQLNIKLIKKKYYLND